jgi:beta-lactam-binding protein with PASTA domain/tRNA A-37 threonylcarbamoyl transferase component Bud32
VARSHLADHVGRVLGDRYRLVAPIGRGGSANVFLAEDITLRRRVAVKLLHAALVEDETFLRRFRAEAHQAAALNHPNIMRVFDWGESEDGPYLVLEYLGGGSLRDLLDHGQLLSQSQALLVGLETARGLDYAHRRGLVHRDIKPANLLFDEEGRACIADFGVARALAEAAWTEPAGAMLGTARYASPEQVQGAALDGKADVYALGLVLVEAVTGQVPFSADTTFATLMARVGAQLEAPGELGPLGPIVERATHPEPDERPDARQLVTALDEAARDLPAPEPVPLVKEEPVVTEAGQELVDLTEMGRRPRVFDAEAVEGGLDGRTEAELLPAARRRRPWWLWVFAALPVLLLLAGMGWVIVQSRVPSHPVPAVQGKTLEEARAIASGLKLDVRVASRRFDENVPTGVILDQDPAVGRLKEGRAIEVVVSSGPPLRGVPDLTGLDRPTAEQRLRDSGLIANVALRHSEDQPKGKVIEWSPRGDQPKGTAIQLVVSDGPVPRVVPDVSGRTYEEAAALLAAEGIKAARGENFHDTIPVGRVIGTRPTAGQRVQRDSVVTIFVSKGPDLVPVPNVAGHSVQEAQATLGAAGLQVTNVFGPPNRRVFTTDPSAGTSVRRGSGVNLYTK